MSLRAALQFIRTIREDHELVGRVEALGSEATLEQLVRLGPSVGFDLTAEELRRTHQHDWGMRWVRYGARPDSA